MALIEKSNVITILIVILIFLSLPIAVIAETDNSALTKEKERLELEASIEKAKAEIAESKKKQREAEALTNLGIRQKEAEASKAEAEAKKGEALAILPPTETKALSGTVDVKNFGSAGLIVAVDLAKEIAAEICVIIDNDKKIIVYDPETTSGIISARLLQTQLDMFQDSLDKVLKEEKVGFEPEFLSELAIGAAVATGTIKTIADLASLFKTNIAVSKTDFSEAESLFITAMANICPGKISDLGFGYKGELDVDAYKDLQNKALKLIGDREQLGNKIILMKELIANANEKEASIRNMKKQLADLNAVAKLVDNFIAVLKTNDISDKSPLFIASKYLSLSSKIENSQVLDIDLKLEGLSIIKENLFTGQKLRLSATAICSYRLYDLKGKILKAGVIRKIAKPVQMDLCGDDAGSEFWSGNSDVGK